MEFRLEFDPKPFTEKMNYRHSIFLAGSCFTEQIGRNLAEHKFKTIDNPNGILFNPVSIAGALLNYIEPKIYQPEDLFFANELWGSWDHHTAFSHPDREVCLQKINDSQARAHAFLKSADWLILTLGSAFVYEANEQTPNATQGRVVANCHKVPADKFLKKRLSIEEVLSTLDGLLYRLRKLNPGLKIIFTVSPVRHLRDGFVENNRSKAVLLHCVHQLVDKFSDLHYFPAYELVLDDLRDYRFFAEDMVHPNYAATRYVWEKFVPAVMDTETRELMKQLQPISAALKHKAFHPQSAAHQRFLSATLEKLEELNIKFPGLDWHHERAFLKAEMEKF